MSNKEKLLDNRNNLTTREAVEVLKFYQENPTVAAKDLLGPALEYGLPWHQSLALKTVWKTPYNLMIWSRGGGKSNNINDLRLLTKEYGYIDGVDLFPGLQFKDEEYWKEVDPVHLWNGDSWQYTDKILVQKAKDSIRIITKRGYSIEGSRVHKTQILENGKIIWRESKDLKVGDISVIGRKQVEENLVNDDLSYLYGIIIGDGCIAKGGLVITSADEEILSFIEKYSCGKRIYDKRSKAIDIRLQNDFTEKLCLEPCLSYSKKIPSYIDSLSKLRSFLQGLFDTDGNIEKIKRQVSFCTTSIKLAKQVHESLLLFGVVSNLREKKTKSPFGKAWIIDISGEDAEKFIARIGFRLSRKMQVAQTWQGKLNSNIDVIYGAKNIFDELKKKYNIHFHHFKYHTTNRKEFTSYSLLNHLNRIPQELRQNEDFKNLDNLIELNKDYFFDPIVSLTDGIANCIDFNVPTGEKYWANGFINHNSFFDAMYAVLSAMLYPQEKVGIFGPGFRQAKIIFAYIEKLYSESPILREFCVKRPISPPEKCYLHFKNGSEIDALPLGTGDTIRGMRYYRIIADEMAQIPEDIFDTVISGFTAVTKSPMEEVYRLEKQKKLIEQGLMRQEDFIKTTANKVLLTSTAFYRFNHLWKRICTYETAIKDVSNKHLNPKILIDREDGFKLMFNDERSILMFDYKDPPEGFMNMTSVNESKLTMSANKFGMEYCCLFPSDSEGFFRRSKLEKARDHDVYTIMLSGRANANYVLGIDVARKSDNFAIAVGECLEDKMRLVNIITLNNRSFKEMYRCILDVLQKFNVIHICMDTGGGGTSLQDLLEDPDSPTPIIDSLNDKDKENRRGRHILDMVKFSDDSIPVMAYKMQSMLDHSQLVLPCAPARFYKLTSNMSNAAQEAILKTLTQYEEPYQEIEQFIDETSSIVAGATPRTGKLKLGLPSEIGLQKDSIDSKVERKDRWTAGMLACWAWHRSTTAEKIEQNEELAPAFVLRNFNRR